jgi:predicted small secreted protein
MIGLALAATLMLGACNTMRGVGKDTEAVGDKIQDEAEQHMADEKKNDPDPDHRLGTRALGRMPEIALGRCGRPRHRTRGSQR